MSSPARRPAKRLGGLDGLRALAVAAVVVFHLDSSLAPGGFLGVDVFFVISGFLITRLIALEITDTGRLRIGAFYLRRARRLLPAVVLLLASVTMASCLVWRDQLATLAGAALSSLAYVTNWWLIADDQSYFVSSGRPSMLQHLWSLAIEEQFYLVWSAVLLGVAVFLGRGGRRISGPRLARVIAPLALLLAAGSTAWSTVLAIQTDLPYGASTSRVYFGADTHSAGLFLGATAGVLSAATSTRTIVVGPSRGRMLRRHLTDALGLAALAVLAWQFTHIDEFRPALYRGGFTVIAAVTLVAVLCASRSGSLLGRALDVGPLRWVGDRSYSIYLWHWPVAVVTRPGYDLHGNPMLLNLARAALIIVLAHLSYRWIETPLRTGRVSLRWTSLSAPRWSSPSWRIVSASLVRWARAVRVTPARSTRLPRIRTLIMPIVAAAAVVCLATSIEPAQRGTAVSFQAERDAPAARIDPGVPAEPAPSLASAGPTLPGGTPEAPAPAGPAAPTPISPAPASTVPVTPAISAFGDSVLLGASQALQAATSHWDVNAVEGVQANKVLDAVLAAQSAGGLAPIVLIHTGNNGIISPNQLSRTLEALSDRSRVILMNDKLPRDWQDPNNDTIASIGAQFPNVVRVDWNGRSSDHPDWFYSDGLHLTEQGREAYTAMVIDACG